MFLPFSADNQLNDSVKCYHFQQNCFVLSELLAEVCEHSQNILRFRVAYFQWMTKMRASYGFVCDFQDYQKVEKNNKDIRYIHEKNILGGLFVSYENTV